MIANKQNILSFLENNKQQIKQFGAKKIGLFGSFVRNQQHNNSDIDLIVEFVDGEKNYKNFYKSYLFS